MKMKIKISLMLGFRRLERLKNKGAEGGKRSADPWLFFRGRFEELQRDALEQELFGSCIILKNMAIVQKGMPMSADYILEQLMANSTGLKNVYGEMLFRWRNGYGAEAFDIMGERLKTKAARSFAFILSKTDHIDPAELVTAMRSFEEDFAGYRMTKAMKRAERKSLITTMAATASIFAILMNFSIVVVFMDMLTMLGGLNGM